MFRRTFSGIMLTLLLVGMLTSSWSTVNAYVDVDVSQARQLIDSKPDLVILDVRTQSEYDVGHIQNATLIPVSELAGRLGELDTNKTILVYCASGGRSATASQTLVDNGFSKVYNMLGGITAWKNAGYWVEIVHNGDLIVWGTQVLTIENCTYVQTGSIYIRDYGKLVARNAVIRLNQSHFWQYDVRVENYAILDLAGSQLTSDYGFNFDFVDHTEGYLTNMDITTGGFSVIRFSGFSKVKIDTANYDESHGIQVFEQSEVSIINSNIGSLEVYGPENPAITIEKSNISWRLSLRFSQSSEVDVKGLQSGFYGFFDLKECAFIRKNSLPMLPKLVLNQTYIGAWHIDAWYDSKTTISDSSISWLGVYTNGLSAYIENLNPQFCELEHVGQIVLNRTRIAGFAVFANEDSQVTINNSTVHLPLESRANVEHLGFVNLIDSVVNGLHTQYFYGVLSFEETLFIGGMDIFYASFYIYGNMSFADFHHTVWHSSNITRGYSVVVKDVLEEPLADAVLVLKSNDGTTLWTDTTDLQGRAAFNLTFADSNYTDTLRLEALKGNLSAVASISFLSDTPVTLTLGVHDVATNDVAPSKAVVGQGFILPVSISIINRGDFAEDFNVTVDANETIIGTQLVSNLSNGTSTTLTFNWNTTGLAYGNYTLAGHAWPVQGEMNMANNNCASECVVVTVPGDIQGDFTADIYDALLLSGAFNSRPISSNWNPNADINNDNTVDIYDAIILAGNFGKTA